MSRREDMHTPTVEAAAWFERTNGVESLPRGWDITADDVPHGPSSGGCGHDEIVADCLRCDFRAVFGVTA